MKIKLRTNLRIGLSLITFFILQLLIPYLDYFAQDIIITKALVYSLMALIIIFLNYNLLSLHFSRLKQQKDRILFIIVGIIFFLTILFANHFFIKGDFPIPYGSDSVFSLFYPLFIIVFSFPFSFTYILCYKVMTDNFNIHNAELKVILLSSILFAALITIVGGNLEVLLLPNFVVNLLITLGISYLYNQTGNLAGGMLSLGFALFIYNIISLLII